jgi:hypothetical protein
MKKITQGTGGAGGQAEVEGDDSTALGGHGGEAVIGDGGPGGKARVKGDRSTGVGGKGGRGGVGPGQPGGDILIEQDDVFMAGGQGGESSQIDGRGGRGGRSCGAHLFGFTTRAHIKPPYGHPQNEPGRGGDAPDTPQYMARKLLVMGLKERYFIEKSITPCDLEAVWYDRTIVDLNWLNETLRIRGYRWQVSTVDDEYEFSDIAN